MNHESRIKEQVLERTPRDPPGTRMAPASGAREHAAGLRTPCVRDGMRAGGRAGTGARLRE